MDGFATKLKPVRVRVDPLGSDIQQDSAQIIGGDDQVCWGGRGLHGRQGVVTERLSGRQLAVKVGEIDHGWQFAGSRDVSGSIV